MEMCIQCGQYPRFSRRGKTYNLCAVCGWRALCKVLKLPDDAGKTDEQSILSYAEGKVAEAVDYVPFEEWAADPSTNSGCT